MLSTQKLPWVHGSLLLTASVMLAPAAFADHEYYEAEVDDNVALAEVLDVEPIIKSVEVPVDEKICWNEKVYHDHPRYRSETPSIIGAIVGGVIGNQFGGGRGKDLATAAGVMIGGSVARDAQERRIRDRSYIGKERRCEIERSWVQEERIVGYDVTYEYDGQIYQAELDEDPGDTLEVRVNVSPVRGY